MSGATSDGALRLELGWPRLGQRGGVSAALGVSEMLLRTVALCASLPRRTVDLQLLLDRGRSEIYRHVARGTELGLVERVAPLRGVEALIVATGDGHALAGTGLPQARISPGQVIHAAICSAVAACLLRAHPEQALISDVELRRDEVLEGRPIASAVMGEAQGRERLHRPDLVLFGPGRPTAIEVELTPKAPQRLLEIVRAWRRAGHVEEVVYVCPPGLTQRAVRAAVSKAHAEERVRVVQLEEESR